MNRYSRLAWYYGRMGTLLAQNPTTAIIYETGVDRVIDESDFASQSTPAPIERRWIWEIERDLLLGGDSNPSSYPA